MNLARWSQTQFLNFNKSAKKIVREKKTKENFEEEHICLQSTKPKKKCNISNSYCVVQYDNSCQICSIRSRKKDERKILNDKLSCVNNQWNKL